jgi:hypothetical protein
MAEEKSSRPGLVLVGALLAGVAALVAFGTSRPGGEGAQKPGEGRTEPRRNEPGAAAAPAQQAEQAPRASQAIRDFFATRTEKPAVSLGGLGAALRRWRSPPAQGLAQKLAASRAECLIVTVPDPIDSRFGVDFDRVVDVVQRAVAVDGEYEFDRAWLPWEIDRQVSGRTPPGRLRESEPGALLFRRAAWDGAGTFGLCVVFLVGENPTLGIDKRAFTRALELIEGHGLAHGGNTVRVVGPFFTGSQASLRMAIDDWLRRALPAQAAGLFGALASLPCSPAVLFPARLLHFRLISGSATGVGPEWLNGPGVSFRAMVAPNRQVIPAVLHYLQKRSNSEHDDRCFEPLGAKVALLVESNTAFGDEIVRPGRARQNQFLQLRFPLHISRLRARVQRDLRLQDEKLGLPVDSLVPDLDDDAAALQDVVPAQGSGATVASNGKVLTNILATILREQARYVGIVATDPRDTLFLAQVIRSHCPGAQVFVVGSDLLLTLPQASYYLKGTIVGSTYPLFAENQRWTSRAPSSAGAHRRHAFPSESAQGCYNAVLAQRAKPNHLVEYRAPYFGGAANERQWARPPIWISMIGQNGDLVPLQYFTEYQDEGYVWELGKDAPTAPAPPPPRVEDLTLAFPGAPLLALVAICAFCLWVITRAFRPRFRWLFWPPSGPAEDQPPGANEPCARSTREARPEGEPRAEDDQAASQKDRREEALIYRTLCLLALAVLLFPLAFLGWTYCWPKWFHQGNSGSLADWGTRLVVLVLPILSLFCLIVAVCWPPLQFAWAKRPRWGQEGPWGLGALLRVLWPLAVVALLGFALWEYYRLVPPPLPTWRALFFERALAFSSGASPLIPLFFLCLALFSWAVFQLKRGYLDEAFGAPAPFPKKEESEVDPFERVRELDGELRKDLRSSWRLFRQHPVAVSLLVAVIAFLGAHFYHLHLPVLEGPLWDLTFSLGFLLGSLLVGGSVVRLLLLWSGLGELMDLLALALPLKDAFRHLPERVVREFGGYFYPQRPRFSRLLFPSWRLAELEEVTFAYAQDVPDGDPTRTTLKKVTDKAQALGKTLKEAQPHATELDARLLGQFSSLCGLLFKQLVRCWAARPGQEAARNGPPDQAARFAEGVVPEAPRDRWARLAEGLVATSVVVYVSQFFVQMRNLAWSATLCSSLLLIAGTSYPFRPERLLLYLLLGLVGAAVLAVLYVLVEINRNQLVSLITNTTPGRFTPDLGFVHSLVTYVGPALAVLVGQLSGAFRFVIEPILRVFK